MATTTYLTTTQPKPNYYKITQHSHETKNATASKTLPKSELTRKFPQITYATTTQCGPGTMAFTWNGGPIEITGIVHTQNMSVEFELLFNEGDAGSRVMGVFGGSLKEGVRVECFGQGGGREMRLEVELVDGRWVQADAERGRWAKKRVVAVLPDTGSGTQL